ncbi:MAG: dihydroorotase [Alistipes sp.]|nr:dihydroorotase [Candidatus Alistipes equi]
MGRLLIKNGFALVNGTFERMDALIEDGRISMLKEDILPKNDMELCDIQGKLLSYGFADIHVHLREPGFSHKETILTGTRAAARGGYTTICAMPNLNPVPDSVENISKEWEIIKRDALIEVLPYASITQGRLGYNVVDMASLKEHCVAFSDDGSGVQLSKTMETAMHEAQREGCIIAAHCEDNSLLNGGCIHEGEWANKHGFAGISSQSEWKQIERDIELAQKTGCRYHVCHISTKESVELIRQAKRKGIKISCETGPHYLVLSDCDLKDEGRFKMNPPLRGIMDRDALIEGIKDGTIDAIATDHAPHTAEEKSRGLKGSAMGIVGLETAFSVLYTKLVLEGIISLERLLELLCAGPRRIFNLGGSLCTGERADLTVIDLKKEYTIKSDEFLSMGHATPFEGWNVFAEPVMTVYNGRIVWKK